MTTIQRILGSTAEFLRWLMSILSAFAQSQIRQAKQRRLLSLMNERELHEMGLSRNHDNESYYHRD